MGYDVNAYEEARSRGISRLNSIVDVLREERNARDVAAGKPSHDLNDNYWFDTHYLPRYTPLQVDYRGVSGFGLHEFQGVQGRIYPAVMEVNQEIVAITGGFPPDGEVPVPVPDTQPAPSGGDGGPVGVGGPGGVLVIGGTAGGGATPTVPPSLPPTPASSADAQLLFTRLDRIIELLDVIAGRA